MTALGVLCCFALFVCLTLLASFFLPSHLSFKNMYIIIHVDAVGHKTLVTEASTVVFEQTSRLTRVF